MLHGPDRVEGDAGGGDDGAAGLGRDPRGRAHARPGAGTQGGLGPRRLGRSRLAVDVGHAEPAADDQLGQPERGEEHAEHLGRLLERRRFEDLAADVRMDPDQLDAGHELEGGDGLCGRPGGDGEAELGVLLPGADELVGVRLHSGRHPRQNLGPLLSRPRRTPAVARGVRSRRTSRRRSGRHRARGPVPALRPTCCCRGGRAAPRGRRRTGRRGARRRTPRRGACPLRGRGAPWHGRGRPWWRRPRRHPTRPRPHGRPSADGPRRTRTAECRIPRASSRRSMPPTWRWPLSSTDPERGRRCRSSGAVATSWSVDMERQDTAAHGRSVRWAGGRDRSPRSTSTIVPCSCRSRPRSSADRAPASGAGGAGSSPAGGAHCRGRSRTLPGALSVTRRAGRLRSVCGRRSPPGPPSAHSRR